MRPERVGLALVLLVYVGLACAYAWFTPPWNNPDEPAHYNYVAYVAERHAFPELTRGDWDLDLLGQAIPERFSPRFDVSALRYESHQPPLYYLMSAPLYWATSGSSLRARVLILRGVSIALGLAFGWAVYRLACEVAPSSPGAGPLSTAIALLIPMSTATAASINNDMLAITLAAVTTLAILWWLRWWPSPCRSTSSAPSARLAVVLGLLVGLLLITKLTVYFVAFMALGTAVLVAVKQESLDAQLAHLRRAALATFVALAVSGWWFLRSATVYGWGDILAQQQHAVVVVNQPRYADFGLANLFYFAVTVFHSFFAQFGWMTIVVDNLTYSLYAAFAVLSLLGAWYNRSTWAGPRTLVLVISVVLATGQLVYYNVSFIQAQGRYLSSALGPIAAILGAGWMAWSRSQGRIRGWAVVLWASLAIATALGGIGDWDVGYKSGAAFILVLIATGYCYARLARGAPAASPRRAQEVYLAAITVVSIGTLNLMCLTRYIIPFYRG
ncbi:MAG TPA: hypothetical protein VHX16_10520 [Chloroflexota bacterium]|nr:hypothetical protein [Chloroflexota bacterium]